MKFTITVGSPNFCDMGPRQGTTRVSFRGDAYLEPEELEAYYAHGLAVKLATGEEPFTPEAQEITVSELQGNPLDLAVHQEIEITGGGVSDGTYRVTGWNSVTNHIHLERVDGPTD